MFKPGTRKACSLVLFPLALLVLLVAGCTWLPAPGNHLSPTSTLQLQQTPIPTSRSPRLLKGKLASLGWIYGRDCQRGLEAYLRTARINPDAALVGTGWIKPTTGKLTSSKRNNCMAGSLSMDNVVQLVHSRGGMA